MSDWYYAKDGQQLGPVTAEAIKASLASGQLSTSDLVWQDGWGDWRKISAVPELSPPKAVAKPRNTAAASAVASGHSQSGAYASPAAPAPVEFSDPSIAPTSPAMPVQYQPPLQYKAAPRRHKADLGDFLAFRVMMATSVIRILFAIGAIAIVVAMVLIIVAALMERNAFRDPIETFGKVIASLVAAAIGMFLWRLYCELFIVIFRINDTLSEIKFELEDRNR